MTRAVKISSLLCLRNQTDGIANATNQGLNFVADTEVKSKHGTDYLQKQNHLMNVILSSVSGLGESMEQLRTSSQKISTKTRLKPPCKLELSI